MSAVRVRSAAVPAPNSAPIASAIGYIIAAVAVFEIHMDMNPVASMTASTARLAPPPIPETMP